ncbi:DUF2507 domain-containing protein [uncultured Limosilactobacillus sp.]|uniref:DUF2507 domain-containing protein n=1 Tax=uncultured Limosilactobacillus sp. TaxID=2837629 RepID=UPI0025FF9405|nr:DUF2507 domain-containing protein [uncultured Limosilactobacillus sp.]
MSQKIYDRLVNSQQGLQSGAIRDVLLPAILGDETDGISYWIGKDLARAFPVASVEELCLLTEQLGLAHLTLKKSDRHQHLYLLDGPVVAERIAANHEETSFQLEAGFLAMETEFQVGAAAEAEVVGRRRTSVEVMVQNDPVDPDHPGERTQFIHLTTK